MQLLGDFLKSINKTKVNLLRQGGEVPASAYPAFVARRLLSYSKDAVLLANELNCTPGIDPAMQYEFFLHVLPKRDRFARLAKPSVEEDVDLLATFYVCSKARARDLLSLHTEEQISSIRKRYSPGGMSK